jgi:hypothetical protein
MRVLVNRVSGGDNLPRPVISAAYHAFSAGHKAITLVPITNYKIKHFKYGTQ